MNKLILTFLISCFIITTMHAQKSQNSDIPKLKKWSIATYLSLYAFGGPRKQLEDQMIRYRFYDPGATKDSPYSPYEPMPTFMISAKYYIKSPFSIGIVGGFTFLGRICGPVPKDANLQVSYSVRYIATIFSYNLYDIVNLGIGPSVYFTKAWESSHSFERVDVECWHTKVGFIIDLGLRIPRKTRFFGEMNVQYRYVGKVDVGPFYVNPNRDPLPQTSVKYDHFTICPGFGVRF